MSHDDKYGRLRATAQSALDEIERCRAKGFYDPVQWLEPVLKAFMDLSQSAIGASAEKAMDRIVENSREQIDEAARNMGKAASIGLGVGPIPAPVSHGGDTPRTDDAYAKACEPYLGQWTSLSPTEGKGWNFARQLERELAEARAALSVATADAGQVAMMLLQNDRDGAMQWARQMLQHPSA